MEDRTDAALSVPEQSTGYERQAWASAGLRRGDMDDGAPSARPLIPEDGWLTLLDEPGECAVPLRHLTPVPEPQRAGDAWAGSAHVAVAGVTVMVITAGLGRRAGVSVRLTALCSAGAGAAVVTPWLVPRFVRHCPWA